MSAATSRSGRDRGMVTAELATVAPFVVALTFLMVWVVSLGLAQVRLTDAAREAARLVARGETVATAQSVARRHAPPDTRIDVQVENGLATVRVRTDSRLPIPFFSGVGSHPIEARATAVMESS